MRVALAVAIAMSLVSVVAADQAAASIRQRTEIPAQNLGTALKSFAEERGLAMIYRAEIVGRVSTRGANGELTLDEALRALLSGTELTYKFLDEKTVTIVPLMVPLGAAPSKSSASYSPARGMRVAQSESVKEPRSTADRNSAAASSEENKTQDSPDKGIQELIVTAQKVTQRAQDVPSSIDVLTGAKLLSQGVVQLADYTKQVPGLNLVGGAGPGQGKVTLRGISTGNDRSPAVSLYLDEVPFTPSSPFAGTTTSIAALSHSFDPDLADIERIEVLAGPQSTLYGASAEGGLIKFVTRQPDFNTFEGSMRTDGSQVDGGGTGYGVRGSVNVPVVQDRVGLRASVFYRRDAGFVDNVSFGNGADINEATVKGARLSLRAKLTERLETTLSGLVQNIEADGQNQVYLNSGTLSPSLGGLTYGSPIDQPFTTKFRALSDTTALDLGFATLTNIASYANFISDTFVDFSVLRGLVGGAPVSYQGNPRSTRYSDELRLTSVPGRLEWLLGGFYTREKNIWDVIIRGTDPAGVILPPSSPYYNVYTYTNTTHFEERAIFGDITWHFTDKLESTVGMRYSSNDQDYGAVATGLLGVSDTRGASSDSAENYLFTVSYKPKSTLTLYVRAASAYRPGGPNERNSVQIAAGVPESFTSDELWNYEAGIKGSAWDQRITFSAAAYHMDWKDVQISVIVQNFAAVGNAAKAKSDGLEAAFQFMPVEDLSISLKGNYGDAKITSNAPTLGAANGDPLPYSPKLNAAALIDYRIPVSGDLVANAGLTYAYHSAQNTAFSGAGSYRLPSYDTLDLRGGLDWSRFSLVARIDNVTDDFAVTSAVPNRAFGAPLAGTVLRPRTFGLSLEVRF